MAIGYAGSDAADADSTEYTFILVNTVDGEDSSVNGTYTGTGETIVAAFVNALDTNNIAYTGFTASDEKIVFGETSYISDWTSAWDATQADIIGAQYAIWTYTAEKGWYLSDQYFGQDVNTVYLISHENYMNPYGPSAISLGVDAYTFWDNPADYGLSYDGTTGDYINAYGAGYACYQSYMTTFEADPASYGLVYDGTTGDYGDAETAFMMWSVSFGDAESYVVDGLVGPGTDDIQYGYAYVQQAPRDLKAAPADVVFGPDTEAIETYTIALNNSVEGQDSSFNGNYIIAASNPVHALIIILDSQGVAHKLDWNAESYYFASGDISDWTTGWDKTAADVLGPNYAIWNYNAEKGWFTGNAFGKDTDTVYIISHENYYQPTGTTAVSLGITKGADDTWYAPAGLTVPWGSYVMKAPRDLEATPLNMVYGPDYEAIQQYTFILNNSVPEQDSDINGTYTGYGANAVQALVQALNAAGITHKLDYNAESVFFASGDISNWTTGWDTTNANIIGPQYAVWNYNSTSGWLLGNTFGLDQEVVYLISHENYLNPYGASAVSIGVDAYRFWDNPADYGLSYDGTTGGYANVYNAAYACYLSYMTTFEADPASYGLVYDGTTGEYDDAEEAFTYWTVSFEDDESYVVDGLVGPSTDGIQFGYAYVQLAPRDLMAAPEDVVFGPDMGAFSEYTIILQNSVDGEDSTFNGTYTAVAANPIQALIIILDREGVENNLNWYAEKVYFATGDISDWTTSWDKTAEDVIGANYAIWNYNAEKGWYTGNSFGMDDDTVYIISHENYYVPTGPTATSSGVSKSTEDVWYAPAGLTVPWGSWLQMAPRDLTATPDKVVLGPDAEAIQSYTLYLENSVDGEDSTFNGLYYGKGETPVQALVFVLNMLGVEHTVDYNAAYVYFGSGMISDWTTAWDTSAEDVIGANFAVWNYNEEKGWYTGNSFGMDDDTVYYISHENYYVPTGPTAVSLGVSKGADGTWYAPAGLTVCWDSWLQMAPRDSSALAPVFGPDTDAIEEYTIILNNSVEGEDSSINGTYTGYGANPVQALVQILNMNGITHKIDYSAEYVYFAAGDISDWSAKWDTSNADIIGPQYAVWNYNTTKGWFTGNSFGMDSDTVYLISHENYMNPYGASAVSIGVDAYRFWDNPADYGLSYDGTTGGYANVYNAAYACYLSYMTTFEADPASYGLVYDGTTGDYGDAETAFMMWSVSFGDAESYVVDGLVGPSTDGIQFGYAYVQLAPRDLMAAPEDVVFGPDMDTVKSYEIFLMNFIEGEDSSFNGSYTAIAASPVQALIIILDREGITHTLNWDAAYVYFGSGQISDWTTAWNTSAEDVIGANFAIWNYNDEKGWYTGNSFGMDDDTVYYISHENYYQPAGPTAQSYAVTVSTSGVWTTPAGLTVPYGSWLQTAPRDPLATPADVVFGPDKDAIKEYTIALCNSVTGEDLSFNGTYTGYGETPVQALVNILNTNGVDHKIDASAPYVYFSSGDISDWTTAWNTSAEDVIGANFAIWNYNDEKGWYTGNSFGMDDDTVYWISHENYYQPAGNTAYSYGVSVSTEGVWTAPAGVDIPWGSWVQNAPRDASATIDNVVFGPDMDLMEVYEIAIENFVDGEDSTFNDHYLGVGQNPVQALVFILNNAKVKHTLDYNAEYIYFGSGMISDWTTAWNASAEDVIGANFAIWNYNEEKGWYTGNSFGMDDDTVYAINHELYYQPAGPSAVAMGVESDGQGGYTCPAGITAPWGSWVQLAPMDLSATFDDLEFSPFYAVNIDTAGGTIDTAFYMLREGMEMPTFSTPTKDGCTFLKWDPEVPSTMEAYAQKYTAVWAVTPVVENDTVEVDLSNDDSNFVMPETTASEIEVKLADNASVKVKDSSAIAAGQTVTVTVAAIENPSTEVSGIAYEFVFTADDKAVTATMQITVAYSTEDGKMPAVYYYNNGNLEEMKVVSYTDDTVTFETNHNSTYIVSLVDGPKEGSESTHLIVPIVVLVMALAAFIMTAWTKKE